VQHLPASELEHFSRTLQILNTNIQAQFVEGPLI
jgi:hypothetical protein